MIGGALAFSGVFGLGGVGPALCASDVRRHGPARYAGRCDPVDVALVDGLSERSRSQAPERVAGGPAGDVPPRTGQGRPQRCWFHRDRRRVQGRNGLGPVRRQGARPPDRGRGGQPVMPSDRGRQAAPGSSGSTSRGAPTRTRRPRSPSRTSGRTTPLRMGTAPNLRREDPGGRRAEPPDRRSASRTMDRASSHGSYWAFGNTHVLAAATAPIGQYQVLYDWWQALTPFLQ